MGLTFQSKSTIVNFNRFLFVKPFSLQFFSGRSFPRQSGQRSVNNGSSGSGSGFDDFDRNKQILSSGRTTARQISRRIQIRFQIKQINAPIFLCQIYLFKKYLYCFFFQWKFLCLSKVIPKLSVKYLVYCIVSTLSCNEISVNFKSDFPQEWLLIT
jgi:hypothetical protein